MQGKRELLARASAMTGATRVIEALPHPPSLLILNYHRIGNAEATPYDSGTFSATTAEFDWQVGYFKRLFEIVSLDQALDIVHGRAVPRRATALLTFDDGYRDNYDEAFPVLRRHGISATFFLPTAFVGTGRLPWWDIIAYLAKNSRVERITLTYPEKSEFDLAPANRRQGIMQILRLFKRPSVTDPERFIRELEEATGCARPEASAERCFLNWDEARTMQAEGMCFGSHTHTHEIIGKLDYARQLEELTISRAIMERELGHTIDTLAYPVGQPDSFTKESYAALSAAKYSTAFSFYSGVNLPGQIEPYNVRRGGVDGDHRSILRLRVALRAAAGRDLF